MTSSGKNIKVSHNPSRTQYDEGQAAQNQGQTGGSVATMNNQQQSGNMVQRGNQNQGRMMNSGLGNWFWPSLFSNNMLSPVQVIEENNHYQVSADIPGIKPEDLDVELENNETLIIQTTNLENQQQTKGQRQSQGQQETQGRRQNQGQQEMQGQGQQGQNWQNERSFYARIDFPEEVKAEQIKAHCENGQLILTVPKSNETHRHRIQIS